MRVKVHPHRNMVTRGIEACISVTPVRKGGKAQYYGTVILHDVSFRVHQSGVDRAQREGVRNVHAWAVGQLVDSHPQQRRIPREALAKMRKVTYHYEKGFFRDLQNGRKITHTDILVAVGRDFWYLP